MPLVTYIEPNGSEIVVELGQDWTVMQGAMSNGIDGIEAQCSGSCACATCHCYVESGHDSLPPPSDNEASMLSNVAAERRTNSRLACQIKPKSALVVRLPERQT
jgi:2Fe-2S ferredoxin